MGQLITIDNITFNYEVSDTEGYLPDEDNLGFNFMTFPPSMVKSFLKSMGNEVTDENGRRRLYFPHEDPYSVNDFTPGSEHDCNNADTQIVFMNHFFNMKRKYQVPYRGMDVYWLFHDSRHALCDVYGNEVCCINSSVEHERLIQGAELAQMHGYSMNGLTLLNLKLQWKSRWNSQEGSSMQKFDSGYFYKMLSDMEKARYDILTELEGSQPKVVEDWEVKEYLMYKDLEEE